MLGPIILLLTQRSHNTTGGYYVPASYVKWLELAGARVVPVSYYASDAEVDELFAQANGALFPGGGSPAPAAARRLYSRVKQAHAAGDYFPLWGTCDGFEWIMQIAAADDSVLTGGFDAENISLPLNLTAEAESSELLGEASGVFVQGLTPRTSVLDALRALPLTMNNHVQAVTPADFRSSAPLSGSFRLLATNADRNGREFVSMVEGAGGLPVWATQFHPEKNIFEQGVYLPSGRPYEAIHHDVAAVAAAQYFANFFVNRARRSNHSFRDANDEWEHLVYQDKTNTDGAPGFVQSYSFAAGGAVLK